MPTRIVLTPAYLQKLVEPFFSFNTTSVLPLSSEEFVKCSNRISSTTLDAVAPFQKNKIINNKNPCLD